MFNFSVYFSRFRFRVLESYLGPVPFRDLVQLNPSHIRDVLVVYFNVTRFGENLTKLL